MKMRCKILKEHKEDEEKGGFPNKIKAAKRNFKEKTEY